MLRQRRTGLNSLFRALRCWKLGLVCRTVGSLCGFEAENATIKEVTSVESMFSSGFLLRITAWDLWTGVSFPTKLMASGSYTFGIHLAWVDSLDVP